MNYSIYAFATLAPLRKDAKRTEPGEPRPPAKQSTKCDSQPRLPQRPGPAQLLLLRLLRQIR